MASWSKSRRGWRGLGRTWPTSSSIIEACPAGNSATSAARPLPNPLFLATFDNLQSNPIVGVGPCRPRIVPGDRQAVAGCLRQPDAARHHRLEDERAEVLAHLFGDVAGEPRAA